MEKLLNKDFKYSIDYEYDTERNCEDNGCIDICRCSKVVNTNILGVNTSNIVNDIYDIYFEDDDSTRRDYKIKRLLYKYDKSFDIYIIDRIVRHYNIWNENNYEIFISRGFYGEEVSSINLNKSIVDKICNEIDEVFSASSIKDIMEKLLIMEYGFIIPELLNKDYEIIDVDKSDIHFGNRNHHESVTKKVLDFYSDENYKGIRGLVYYDGTKFRVIDGYHRIHTTNKTSVKVINVK